MSKIRLSYLIFFIYLTTFILPVFCSKKNGSRCSSSFLWNALTAASRGNGSAKQFLYSELKELGFHTTGIRKNSVASFWQTKIKDASSQKVFSSLQKISMTLSRNYSNIAKLSALVFDHDGTSQVQNDAPLRDEQEIATFITSTTAPMLKNRKTANSDLQKLIRAITKLFRNTTCINYSNITQSDEKIKRKQLRRFITSFLRKKDQPSRNAQAIKSKREAPGKPIEDSLKPKSNQRNKNKSKSAPENAVLLCLQMINELVDMGVCEDVDESFKWTLNEVQENIKSGSGEGTSITTKTVVVTKSTRIYLDGK